jgi:hypothetical protein
MFDRCRAATESMGRLEELVDCGGLIGSHVVHMGGRALTTPIRTGWEGMREHAGLGRDVVPHLLRHTSVTPAMQGGARNATGFFGSRRCGKTTGIVILIFRRASTMPSAAQENAQRTRPRMPKKTTG